MIGAIKYNKIHSVDMSPMETSISIVELKKDMHVDYADDDDNIQRIYQAALSIIEKFTGMSLCKRDITIYGEFYEEFELPYGYHGLMISVKDENGVTIASGDYKVIGDKIKRFIPYKTGRMVIKYEASGLAPVQLMQAAAAQVNFLYENKGDETELRRVNVGICQQARVLAWPFKRLSMLT